MAGLHQPRFFRPGKQAPKFILFIQDQTHDQDRLYLFDTTLRDGAQTNGLDSA